MKENTKLALIILLAIVVFGIGIWWQIYKYGDCRAVGHSWLYCIGSIGK